MSAWKDLERRVCASLGGRRAGPTGATSDCVNVPFSVEIKRTVRAGPPVLGAWVTQAKRQSRLERRPWLIVVAGHNDRRPVAVLDLAMFVQIAERAGLISAAVESEGDAA